MILFLFLFQNFRKIGSFEWNYNKFSRPIRLIKNTLQTPGFVYWLRLKKWLLDQKHCGCVFE